MYCYFSKNYNHLENAGNKAKTDIETIMHEMGYANIGRNHTLVRNKVAGFVITLAGMLKTVMSIRKGDVVVIQYPLKKYYDFIVKSAHRRGARTVTLIHDLGSFRRKKLTVKEEIERLNRNDGIIAHTPAMKQWLEEHGVKVPIVILGIFDYLCDRQPGKRQPGKRYQIVFAGPLRPQNSAFLYALAQKNRSYELVLYGNGFDKSRLPEDIPGFTVRGFCPPEKIITESRGDFGLVWYGPETETIAGPQGEYLPLIAPHKLSLYLRAGMPVIVWSKSAMAPFVEENGIGIAVDSLDNLDSRLALISSAQLEEMRANATRVAADLAAGANARRALLQMMTLLEKKNPT